MSGRQTKEAWKETFNEDFFMPGGMYRGSRPTTKDFNSNDHINYIYLDTWLLQYELIKAQLVGNRPREANASFNLIVLGNIYSDYFIDLILK